MQIQDTLFQKTSLIFSDVVVNPMIDESIFQFVVPKGVEHKPSAEHECKIMIVEPRDVVNTGGVEGELTADNDVWI